MGTACRGHPADLGDHVHSTFITVSKGPGTPHPQELELSWSKLAHQQLSIHPANHSDLPPGARPWLPASRGFWLE